MKKLVIVSLFLLAILMAGPASAVWINEIRIDQTGTDYDDYFEVGGEPGESLAGLTYLVIGDASTAPTCGAIEAVIDLSSYSIQADGLFAACRTTTPLLTGYDVLGLTAMNFENSDNVTHLLVSGFTGTSGQDLDTNNDGVLDITPWSSILDSVGFDEGTTPDCLAEEYLYSATTVGPEGAFVPGHIFACGPRTWFIGVFATMDDTPGNPNTICVTPTEDSSWGSLKSLYR